LHVDGTGLTFLVVLISYGPFAIGREWRIHREIAFSSSSRTQKETIFLPPLSVAKVQIAASP